MRSAALFCLLGVGVALVARARAGNLAPWLGPLLVAKPASSDDGQSDSRSGPPRYAFDYSFNDPSAGDVRGQWELREGDVVKGSYTIIGPDGGVRTVEYTSDGRNGFRAIVKKNGIVLQPSDTPKSLAEVPLFYTLKPLLGVLPTASTPTTTAAPPTDPTSLWPSGLKNFYDSFWKKYSTFYTTPTYPTYPTFPTFRGTDDPWWNTLKYKYGYPYSDPLYYYKTFKW